MRKQRDRGCTAFPEAEYCKGERLDPGCNDINLQSYSRLLLSPKHLLCMMAVSIFLAEAVIMFLLAYVPQMPFYYEVLLDTTALLLILSPTFYFFHYQPLRTHSREHQKIVSQLSDSEERFNLASNAVIDGLWDWNMLTGGVYASVHSSTMLGFQPGELGDRIESWGSLLHPDDREEVEGLFREHLEGDSDSFRAEYRLRHKNGHYLWVMGRGQVVSRSVDNRPQRMIGTCADITNRKQAEEALRRSEVDIRTLSRKIMNNSEEEKKHLAQELHDEFGQVLCAFHRGVEVLREHNYGPEQNRAQCDGLLALVKRLEANLRHMRNHLRPVMLDEMGLVPALKWHLEQFSEQHPGIETSFVGLEQKIYLPHEKEIVFYRICQEALNNIGKYASASRIAVDLQMRGQQLLLSIRDNGIGFNEELIRRKPDGWGLGLLGMRESAAAVGGGMFIDSSPGEGTKINVALPLESTTADLCGEAWA